MATSNTEGPFAFLSRRRFLKLGLAAGGTVLGIAGGGMVWLRNSAPAVSDLRILRDHEYQTLERLVEVMFPPSPAIPIDVRKMDLPRAFDSYLADEPKYVAGDLQTALTLIELGPILFDAEASTFSRLLPQERAEHWEGWANSDLLIRRQVSLAMRKFFHLVFFDQPEVWPHIGYPGPSLLRKGRAT